MSLRPFTFGAICEASMSGVEWRDLCRTVEDVGCSTLLVSDHFGDQLALVPALTSALDATSHLRVGALVACNDYRNPVMYAKELATIDVLSDGRVDWGMGAGWLSPEYAQVGIPFEPGPVRASRLIESVRLMKGLFADAPVTFEGEHYRVRDLNGTPKPLQRPHPPLLLAGSGRRLLSFAGAQADIVGIAPSLRARRIGAAPPECTVEAAMDDQIGWIRAGAGERFGDLVLNAVAFPSIVTANRTATAEKVAPNVGYTPDEVLRSPHVWIGTVEEICRSIAGWRERWGLTYWAVNARSIRSLAPIIERMAGC